MHTRGRGRPPLAPAEPLAWYNPRQGQASSRRATRGLIEPILSPRTRCRVATALRTSARPPYTPAIHVTRPSMPRDSQAGNRSAQASKRGPPTGPGRASKRARGPHWPPGAPLSHGWTDAGSRQDREPQACAHRGNNSGKPGAAASAAWSLRPWRGLLARSPDRLLQLPTAHQCSYGIAGANRAHLLPETQGKILAPSVACPARNNPRSQPAPPHASQVRTAPHLESSKQGNLLATQPYVYV